MPFRVQAYPRQHRGYHLLRQLDVAPSKEDQSHLDYSIVSPLGGADLQPADVPASWSPFPSIGEERLYVTPSIDERALPARFIQPLVCRRRGQPSSGVGYIGVDSRVWMNERLVPPPTPCERPLPTAVDQPEFGLPRQRISIETMLRAIGLPAPHPTVSSREETAAAVRVAVIDTDCGGWGVLRNVDEASLRMPPEEPGLRFPRVPSPPDPVQRMAGHGVVMAAAVEAVAPGVRLGLFEIPLAHATHTHGTDLAAALARAVGGWNADVVLVAMAHAGWGAPAHLRSILRGCARNGRGGRGAIIVCCTGRIDQNRDLHGDSAVLPSDDFNAQPWVIPVAACGLQGGWYRVNGHPLGRLGPSVELCAPGELVTFPSVGAADDSSLAAALVAGTAARMVATNPTLTLSELRQLLRATALKLPSEEAPAAPGLEADCFNEWDAAGQNFKLGHGCIDAEAACLAAADPVCYALLVTGRAPAFQQRPATSDPAVEAARSWDDCIRDQAARHELCGRYLALRGALVPLVLRSPDTQDALFWLARHFRALRRYGPPEWPEDGTDHSALSDRCVHVLETFGEQLAQTPAAARKEVVEWLTDALRLIETSGAQAMARFLATALAFSSAPSN
jgi:hypothetical protein